ncbi:SYT4 [Symbiodinium sp. CCMP2592]|nr:SYT4 [Symbiodinium sp. CCMP2592]
MVYSTYYAFAALKTDGTVVTWGDGEYGGNSSDVAAQLTNVEALYSTAIGFAARKPDGTVVLWGYTHYQQDMVISSGELVNVIDIFSSQGGFAAVRADGSIVSWSTSFEPFVLGARTTMTTSNSISSSTSRTMSETSTTSSTASTTSSVSFSTTVTSTSTSTTVTSTSTSSNTASSTTSTSFSLTMTGTSTSSSIASTTTSRTSSSSTSSSISSSRVSASTQNAATLPGSLDAMLAVVESNVAFMASHVRNTTSSSLDWAEATAFRIHPLSEFGWHIFVEGPHTVALQVEVGNEDLVLVLSAMQGPEPNPFLYEGLEAVVRGVGSGEHVVAPVDVTLHSSVAGSVGGDLNGSLIYIRMTDVSPQQTWVCAYLDGDEWSTQGVRIASQEELAALQSSANTTGTWCVTNHLTMFSIIDILLDCTNLNVLSEELLRNIVERPNWWNRWPAASLWALLGALLLLLGLGARQDGQIRKSGIWRDEYFLTDVPPVADPSRWCRLCRVLCHPSAPRVTQTTAPTPTDAAAAKQQTLNERVMKLKPGTPQKLQENIMCENTLAEAARHTGLHRTSIRAHIWGLQGWIQGSLAVQQSPQLKELVMEMEESLPHDFVAVHASWSHRFRSTFLALHPVYEILLVDLHTTAAKRAKITMDCLFGSLAFAAVFFSVDGSAVAARNAAACPVQQNSLVWIVSISLVSVLLNFLPRHLVSLLAARNFVQALQDREQQLRMRWYKDCLFWFIGICFTLLHLLFITAFLANLGVEHEWKWMTCFAVVLLRKLVFVPFLASLLSLGPSLVGAEGTNAAAPERFGLDLPTEHENMETTDEAEDTRTAWNEKVQELAGRGITVRQLLDFYSLLGSQVMHHFDPEASTTHDVVRQAIIPLSMQLRESRSFTIALCGGTVLWPRLSYEIAVVSESAVFKPWKGTATGTFDTAPGVKPKDVLVVEDLFENECLHLRIWDSAATPICALETTLSATSFWDGFNGDVELETSSFLDEDGLCCVSFDTGAAALSLSITPKASDRPSRARPERAQDAPASAEVGYAYATCVNNVPRMAVKMVTHSWRNNFAYLFAAVLSDALEVDTYDHIAQLLKADRLKDIFEKLRASGKLEVPYWICAFCVNQHAGICATPPAADSAGVPIAPCRCATAKHFQGDLSEMNKFDDMMAYLKVNLKRQSRQDQSKVRLEQVVAMEVDFGLLTRVWCVAELVEANSLHLPQAIKMHSAASRDSCLDRLLQLDVRAAEASFPADKELVLSKITDVEDFNMRLPRRCNVIKTEANTAKP